MKPGYKQTDIGVIPHDWDCERVGEAAAKIPNAIVGGPFGSDLVSADYVEDGVPVIRGQNMVRGSVSGEFAFVSQTKARKLSANLAHAGDIVFTQRGTLGQVALVPKDIYKSFLVSQSQMKLSLNTKRHDPHYVVQYFSSQFGQKLIFDSAIQTGVPHTNLGILRAYQFPAPPIAEQRAIAAALTDVNAELAGLGQLVAKKRDLKLAAMQQLLTGQTRLPGFGPKVAVYKKTEVGDIPEDWEAVPVGNLFTFKNGLNKAKHFFGYGTPIVNYMDVFGRPLLRMAQIVGRVDVSPRERNAYEVRKGDVFFTRTSETVEEIGIASVMLDVPKNTVYSGFVLRARPIDGSLDDRFKGYCFSPGYFRRQVMARASYTTRALTNGRSLSATVLARPSLSEQRAIATVLSDIDAELALIEARVEKTRALKQAMMQALLTGRIRLPVSGPAPEPKVVEAAHG